MKTVSISASVASSEKAGAHRLDLTVNTANDITQYIFVKERILRPDNTFDDVFVCIASPAQLEDLPQLNPGTGSYFRDNAVSLISSDPNYLTYVKDGILADVQLLLSQATELDNLSSAGTYTVTPVEITLT